ncbi:tRNA (guanine(6)-N2)-methyltransferase [Candidatus Tiddalikarchaeum anstoanum]|nr:tRNA (guanine(6)-N2)-methyltransferase [Candidatus Tiddalikarchaeum anstoanum]
MRLAVLFEKTLKEYAAKELGTFTKVFEEIAPGYAITDADYKELNIKSRFLQRVGILIGFFEKMSDFKGLKYSDYLSSNDSFKVRCDDKTVCVELGQYIKDATNAKVSLDNPVKIFYAERLNNKLLVFLDTTGEKKLTQRGYTSTNVEVLTSDAAAAIVLFSGWTPDKVLIDLYCNQGYIIIEAVMNALNIWPGTLKTKSFNFEIGTFKIKEGVKLNVLAFSTTMNDIKNAKQNCQLAGVYKFVKFGTQELNAVDYDLGENKVDYVISAPPRDIDWNKLFFQLEYIVRNNGIAVLYTSADINAYKEYKIELVEQASICGKNTYKFQVKKK